MTQESIPTSDTSTTDPVVTGATDPTTPEDTTEETSSVTPSQQLWVTLDQSDADYAPGETVGITASNVSTGGSLEFSVGHVSAGADGILGTADDVISGDLTGTGTPWVVTDGGAGDLDGLVNGAIQTSWYVNPDALNQAFVLSATDQASGQVATASFTDAAPPDASGAAADLTKDLSAVPGGDPTHNIGGALFQVYHVKSDFGQSAGTGTFDSFVQVQGPNNPPTEQGYNYDRSGTYGNVLSPQYNENTSGEHNKALLLSDLPIVTINGVNYREFLLDSNEATGANKEFISLDSLQIFQETSGTLGVGHVSPGANTPFTPGSGFGVAGEHLVYNMDASGNVWVAMNSTLSSGSGDSDIRVLVPDSAFLHDAAHQYIYVYSAFGFQGGDWQTNSGFEEWGTNPAALITFDISGKKYTDANGDGLVVGDVGLGGITIYIEKDGIAGLTAGDKSTVTAADGSWSFTGLDSSYDGMKVFEVLPNGYVQTLGQAGYTIDGISGQDQTGLNFANFEKFDISGKKFTDANGDGQTVGDVGLGGVTIFIDKNGDGLNNDGAANQTVTAADGTWSFTGLDASYAGKTVYEVLPNGYVQTLGQAGYQIVGTSGNDQTGLNFANFEKFDISGKKFTDANGDGQTVGDVGLGGVTIFIDKNGDGLNNDGAANQTVTAADGTWSFTGLDASYAGKTVYEVLPNGYVQTLGQAGYQIVGTSGNDQTGMNFANFEKFDISGKKFTDTNGDGQTVGDVGLGGVTIFIDKNGDGLNNDGAANQTVTAADGTWSFTGLDASYAGKTVYEVLPNGYVQTLGQAGYQIVGTSGNDQTGLNFANFEKFDISGKKFTDANGDGQTAGDVGLGGVTIFIDKNGDGLNNDGAANQTVTAADGTWSFTGLDASYAGKTVYEVLPNGYVQTLGQAGYQIVGTSGNDQTGLNFANFEKFDISGKKFTDANGDGQTVGDVGLGGVTIFIDKNGDGLNNDGAANQTVTAADGTWSFTGLDASYAGKTVYEVLPNGYVQTLGQAGYTIVGTSGNDQTGLNFANFEKFDISGKKFTDANGDGQTAGDVGLGGVTIFIDKNGDGLNNDGAANQTVTAADGTWSFTGLDASYAGKTVYEVLPNGYVQTLGQAGYQIVGTSGNDQTGLNFANFEKFDISGKKFTDANGDGQIVGDVGLGGVTIFIDKNGDGLNNDGAANQTVTAADGTWSFTGLDASYAGKTVYEVLPNGYVQTLGQAGYQIVGTSGHDQTGLDFANFAKFGISGTKFTDANGDGQTVGDVGLGGVTIFIDKNGDGLNNDGAANQTVTAADGTWSFTGLDASYAGKTVYEVLPNGYVQTLGQAGYQIVGTSGSDQTGLNFANFEKFDISGTKFTDTNGDGQTAGDVGLGGVTIFIDKNGDGLNNDGAANQTVTAADGTWSFTGLDASYAGKTVYEVLPNGYVQTLGQAGYQIVGTSGHDQTGLDFANFAKFGISGTKFTDANGDGQTVGDVGLGGVTIFIDKNGDGLNNDGAANQTVTAADGTWSFNNLDASYAGKTVYEVLPNGYIQTLGQAGYVITGTSGQNQTGLNFANFEKFDISGTKFTDANGDGQTAGDVGLGGVTIFIDKNGDGLNNDGAANQTVTAADGTWSFTGLDASYAGKTVYEVLPNGYVQTLGQAGYQIVGTSGNDQTGLNFANFEKFDISGTKFTDANGDGQTAGDVGLGGVTIFIDKNGDGLNNDGAANQTVTAADGSWSFANLDASYAGKKVYEVLPNGYVQTLGQAGYTIVGTSGNDQTGLNFANFEKFDISGKKFLDANGDGQTAGDAGLGGVTIFIDKNGDGLNNDGAANQTVTAADGTWSFTGLDASYAGKTVYEVLPNGYVQTLGQAGYQIVGTSGNDQTGLNFANFEKFDISGKKFLDANGDGLTTGDAGLGGITIYIEKDGIAGLTASDVSTVTAADGTWSFQNLDASYAGKKVYEVLPNGYVQSLGQAGYTIVGTSGNDQTGMNFANFVPGSIHGFKFNDMDANGKFDGTDVAMAGITIQLKGDVDGNGTIDTLTTTTDANGFFAFVNLHPGTYTISELFTDGNSWAATVDHNNDGVGDATTTVTITSGQELVAVKGEAGQLDPLHSEVVVGNTLTFGNHELGAVGLTPGFWYNHLYVWDAPIIGADTSNGGVDGKGVSLASKLAAAGTIEKADIASLLPGNVDVDKDNHKDLIVTGSNGKTLVIEWDDAREIVGASNGTGGDKLGDFARYAITTLLNDVGVPDFNAPNGVLTDIADWLLKNGGVTQKDTNGDGSITAADGYVLNYNNAIEPGKDGFTTSVKANSAAWQTAVAGVPSGSSIFAAMNALTDSTTQNMVVSQNQSHVVMATDLGDHFGLLGVALNSGDGYLQLHA